MKVSTKGRYALRLMIDIAEYGKGGNPVRLKDVAARQKLSGKYLEQIIAVLNKAGYVRSIRGPQGGYLLSRKPSEYTAGMILRLTEGSLAPISCLEDGTACDMMDDCATIKLWRLLNDAINNVVDSVTLEDLIEWHRPAAGDDYVI